MALAIGYFGGRYLDRRLDTAPVLTWVGFLAGVGAGIKALVRVVRAYNRQHGQAAVDHEEPGEKPS